MSRTILLIDDSEAIQLAVKAELAVDGHKVIGAPDGTTGIAVAMRTRPDMILLDVSMPGLDGYEVCELLAIQQETANIPVFFLSANAEPADRIRGLQAGATDYIAKPFIGDELRARVRVALRYKSLMEMEARRAMRDGLTGLWNRKCLDERLAQETAEARRYGRPLSCIMLDVDHFKALNDRQGHSAGDTALRGLADLIEDECRREDVACRYGGEEFAILCPNVDALGAGILAERLRVRVESTVFEGPQGTFGLTCSFGVADGVEPSGLLELADVALYQAKHGGRNRVVVAAEKSAMPATSAGPPVGVVAESPGLGERRIKIPADWPWQCVG